MTDKKKIKNAEKFLVERQFLDKVATKPIYC